MVSGVGIRGSSRKRKTLGDGLAVMFVERFFRCTSFCVPERGLFLSGDAFSKCHPLTNFLYFLGAIGFSAVIQHPWYLAASCLFSGAYCIVLRGRKGAAVVGAMIPAFLVLTLFNSLFNTLGSQVLFSLFGRSFTWEALCHGMAVSGVFVSMMLWFFCYSLVLTSDKFVALFGSLIPSLSLLLVMILRMIPNLLRRGSQILQARRSIGKGAEEGSTARDKLLDGMNVLSALTDWALEGGIVTADSMRARGYGATKRTSFRRYRLGWQDFMLTVLMLLLSASVLLLGGTGAEYTPVIAIAPLTGGFWAYCLFLALPLILYVKEDIQWRISISRI